MKIFFFSASTKKWFETIFLSGSLAVFKIAAKPLKFWGLAVAAAGGEMRSNYFQDSAPARNCQVRLARYGGLGNQIVGNFGRKNQLAVLFLMKLKVKENFFNYQ